MEDPEFWRDLAERIRPIDPIDQFLRAERRFTINKEESWKAIGVGEYGESARRRFMPLITRAVIRLGETGLADVVDQWVSFLAEKMPDAVEMVPGGNAHMVKRLCARSIDLCSILEAESLQKQVPKRDHILANAIEPLTFPPETSIPESPPVQRISRSRVPNAINSETAATHMLNFIATRGLTQPRFAESAKTTERTIRSFAKTGKVRKSIFIGIANAMGTTPEELLNRKLTGN